MTYQTLPDRFAVIADVHGNSDALRAVLQDIQSLGIGRTLNLGDHFSGPLDAGGTAQILGHPDVRANMLSLRGNHDRYLIEQAVADMGPSDRAAHAALPPSALDWIRNLPVTLALGKVFACHAAPHDDQTYWTHEATAAGGVTLRSRARIEAFADGIDAGLILSAHTHLPIIMGLSGGRVLVNPGSVGCPAYTDTHPVPHVVETGSPRACYAVIQQCDTGLRVVHRHVPYDTARIAGLARGLGRKDWAQAVETGWISPL